MTALLVDSHCHLNMLDLAFWDGEMQGALDSAQEQGIGHMLCVCVDMENFPDVLAVAEQHENIFASVGVHPNVTDDKEHSFEEPSVEKLIELANNDNIIAIGETGLDYFRSEGDLDWQRDRFRRHIEAAKQTKKPLIIHSRESTQDILQIMKEEGADEVGGVMHCFVDDWEVAKQAMDLNFYISLSGIVTFKNAQTVKDVAKKMPEDRLLVETDSPYLAPVPYRGKMNQPAYVRYVAEHIAELRNVPYEQITQCTTKNFFTLFKAAERRLS
ncbi:MAG: TatD family hydrolase [Gammaproteobacteria bacterium]|nr:TatD family hydrolase [Gammaproteobacteria bacterium]